MPQQVAAPLPRMSALMEQLPHGIVAESEVSWASEYAHGSLAIRWSWSDGEFSGMIHWLTIKNPSNPQQPIQPAYV